jgi:DNA modification methylase
MQNLSERPAGLLSKVAFPNPEFTTVWSFPVRGAWATHNNKYRGNFAPQLARNVIEMYSSPGEVVLDPMAGGGTTLIEAKLLGRGFIGCDINPVAVKLCEQATEFETGTADCADDTDAGINTKIEARNSKQIQNTNVRNIKQNKNLDSRLRGNDNLKACGAVGGGSLSDSSRSFGMTKNRVGTAHPTEKNVCADARDLGFIGDGSIDLVLTHPPYLNIIRYGEGIAGDLSAISSVKKFCGEMALAAAELYRVLKPGRHCAMLMGDTRRGRHFVPLAYRVMDVFMGAGFILKEDIIKVQHNCSATSRWVGKAKKAGFYLIMHEHLFIFRKPQRGEDLNRVKESCK